MINKKYNNYRIIIEPYLSGFTVESANSHLIVRKSCSEAELGDTVLKVLAETKDILN